MYYILCKNLTTNNISKSDRVFFPFQIDSIIKELNDRKDNCLYYKELEVLSWLIPIYAFMGFITLSMKTI